MKKPILAMEFTEYDFCLRVSALEVKFEDRERNKGVIFVNGQYTATLDGVRYSPRRRQFMTWTCSIEPNEETVEHGAYCVANNKGLSECLAMVVWDLARRTLTMDVETPDFVGMGWFGSRDAFPFSWNVRDFVQPPKNPQVIDHRDQPVEFEDPLFTDDDQI